jgi:hypothetical protein
LLPLQTSFQQASLDVKYTGAQLSAISFQQKPEGGKRNGKTGNLPSWHDRLIEKHALTAAS